MPSERREAGEHTKDHRSNSITVTIAALRRRGFEVETEWGVGYRMKPVERERLAASDWYQRALTYGHADSPTAVLVSLPKETFELLRVEAEDRGQPFEVLAARVMELGLSELLEEPVP